MDYTEKYDKYMLLQICIYNQDLKKLYIDLAEKHNHQTENAGFDIFTPEYTPCLHGHVTKIDFQIKCKATMITDSGKQYNTGFYMYPRSSLSKTPLRLANSVGIIDSGYRGNLIGAFDLLNDCAVKSGDRLVQICAPGLVPIMIIIVDEMTDDTMRGSGGFGSTGI